MVTILVADDNPVSRELLCEVLEEDEIRVIEAGDGQEALHQIQAEQPDLVLLDIQMPVLDGYQVLEEIRKLNLSAPMQVIALTAFAMEGDRQRVLDAGFDGYVSKPIDVIGFRKQLASLLRKI